MRIEIRDLHKLEPENYCEGTVDILVTSYDGTVRQSLDVYANAELAKQAMDALFSNWDVT